MAKPASPRGKKQAAALSKRASDLAEKHGFEDVSGGGEVQKWEAGRSVVGVYIKLKDGTYGPLLILRTSNGTEVFGCPAILNDRITANAVPGDQLYIECLGKTPTASGTEAWDFTVLRKSAHAAARVAKGDELPF